ncbi:MAG: diaminopimelate epimerase [Lachnospiraceae bacterium]|nr:diaminopimelate epimerase [Lachnospiraceae bacterium]
MKFVKMQGCGNDYIYVDGSKETVEHKPDVVRKLSDRHFGIGGDGVIFINPSKTADFEMEMYNADGSRSEMCGNGIRCVAKYVYDYGLTEKTELAIESAGKVKYITLYIKDGKVDQVKVNMGAPELQKEMIPVEMSSETESVIGCPICIDDEEYRMTCVSMGNPHAVVFMDEIQKNNSMGDTAKQVDLRNFEIEKIGPKFEHHPCFPNRTNTEFVEVIDRHTVDMRVWERGTGETLACGTGCCAVVVACVLNGRTEEDVTVRLLGGELQIHWDRTENCVYMTGPARVVFEGEVEI